MYTVLVALDDSEARAVAQAEAVADLPSPGDVRAVLFHAFRDNPDGASVTQLSSVRRAAEVLEAAGVAVEYEASSGDPAQAIMRAAEDVGADAISLAGRRRTPAGKVLFGSVTQAVLLGTERPAFVVYGE